MSQPQLITVTQDGDVIFVSIHGSVSSLVDDTVLDELETVLHQIQVPHVRGVVVDLEEVDYFGSSLLEALRVLWRQVEQVGGKLALCNVSEVGREILQIAKFDTLWPICEDREEARAVVTAD